MKMNLESTSVSRFLILAFGLVLSANKTGKLRSLITKWNTLASTGLIHSATMAPQKLKNLRNLGIYSNWAGGMPGLPRNKRKATNEAQNNKENVSVPY